MSDIVRIKEEPDDFDNDFDSKDGWITEYYPEEDADVSEMQNETRCIEDEVRETEDMRMKEVVNSHDDDDDYLEDDGHPDVKIKVEEQNETTLVIDEEDSPIQRNESSEIPFTSESMKVSSKPSPTTVSVIDDILSLLETFGDSLGKSPLMDSSCGVFSFSEKDEHEETSKTGKKCDNGEVLKMLDSKSVSEMKGKCLGEKSLKKKQQCSVTGEKTTIFRPKNSADMNIHCTVEKEADTSEQGCDYLASTCRAKKMKCKFCDKEVNFGTLNKHQRHCRDKKTAGRIKTLKVKVTKQINVTKEMNSNSKSKEKVSFRNLSSKRKKRQKLESTHECKACGKVFRILSKLVVHVRTHTGEKPFKCKYCGKKFGRPELLERHERLHTKERPFKCGYCDRRFNGKQDVQKHERTHTGERPYKCNHCGKAFKDLGTLRPHEKIHTGEKPFKCKYCDMAFIRGCYLRRHERTHTGEKPFTCKKCGRAFSRMYTLRCHEKKIHNM